VPSVLAAGCGALRALCAANDAKARALSAGAMEAVVSALRAHPSNEAVQSEGYAALHCLVSEPALSLEDVLAHAEGGARAVAEALAAARGETLTTLTRAALLLVGTVLASAAAAREGVARVGSTCASAVRAALPHGDNGARMTDDG
jgi:hypothetical protein